MDIIPATPESLPTSEPDMMSNVPSPPSMPIPPVVSSEGGDIPVTQTIPPQDGLHGSGRKSAISNITFEDYFPKLNLSEDHKKSIAAWFDRDLRSCIRNVNRHRRKWATYRAVYMMEYVEKFYPDMGIGATYSSGLILEKMLEGMDRMKRAILSASPLFVVDTKMSGADNDVEFVHRAQWLMDTLLRRDLEVSSILTEGALFDFLLDGSAIIEADTVYEKVPQRTIKTYDNLDDLMLDEDKALDPAQYEKAMEDIQTVGMARMLVEDNVVTKDGLQLFHVDKRDHLVPEKVFSDRDLKFRGRRMYLTSSDLRLLASDDVKWYDKDAVDKILNERMEKRGLMRTTGEGREVAMERVTAMENNYDLMYPYRDSDSLIAESSDHPYEEMFAIYRVTCKYGYVTKNDPDGVIPKYCLIDYSPEGGQILRAVTYPHFKEKPNWFHMKFGFAPESYYGLGFGARLIQDDFLESNAVDLFLDAAAFTTFQPSIAKHPEEGGRYPWMGGYGPGKVGYVNDMGDYKQLDVKPPSASLLNILLPLTQTRASNRTNVTSLVQGRTESSDPRSPASKTSMLLSESQVGLDVMVSDWNDTGWNKLASYVWNAAYEIAMHVVVSGEKASTALYGLVVDGDAVPEEMDNKVTMAELGRDIVFKSQASSTLLNPQQRMDRFLQMFQFFVPLLEKMAQFQPDVFKIYFMRWMRKAAEEVDLPGMSQLIPTQKEINNLPPDQLMGTLQSLMENLRAGRGPGALELGATSEVGGGE